MNFFRKIWKPELYHGFNKTNNFFEGWFYKIVNKEASNTVAIIPGIFKSKNSEREHAFIQVLHGENNISYYIKYPAKDFTADKNTLNYAVGESSFSESKIKLKIEDDNLKLNGEIEFNDMHPWPVKLFSPGVMGWYGFIPFMECNHGVLSMNHFLKGSLILNDTKINFNDGKGYIEKDWGTSFPSSYVWVQSNNFENDKVSFSGSIAKIPWLRNWFRGFIIGFLLENKLYRFTTYTGAKLKYLNIEDDFVEFEVTDKKFILYAKAYRTPGVVIHGPYDNQMIKTVSESLSSKVQVKLIDRNARKTLFEGIGTNAGLDVNGKLEEIIG